MLALRLALVVRVTVRPFRVTLVVRLTLALRLIDTFRLANGR
jgi:hypothetical protein